MQRKERQAKTVEKREKNQINQENIMFWEVNMQRTNKEETEERERNKEREMEREIERERNSEREQEKGKEGK